ncbi:FG-GAP-like repeat-containing protein [Fulvivirgaceae bacterium BMA10]|uniref:FG-GAP-like repeat-containing protein n=1 Tax=Splendidivirga corallicola TaxID=3051826 RepID=A0ABT8KNE8_9BACT|nr:FG-GAP-like repeat-containing protein [Fulvivirgaceae bacterium BMA10]
MTKVNYLVMLISLVSFGYTSAQGFKEIAVDAGINHFSYDPPLAGTGLAFIDIDNDGDEDLYVIGGFLSDKLYENDGKGNFNDITDKAGLDFTGDIITRGVIAGDIDNDGDRDIFVTTSDGFPNILLENKGDGTFKDISESAGFTSTLWSMAASFGDYDQDGLIDLYIGNYIINDGDYFNVIKGGALENELYKNLGNGKFENVSSQFAFREKGATLVSAFTDVDGDRDLDLFVGNDLGVDYTPNYLYIYDSVNGFTNLAKEAGVDYRMYAMGIGIGDYDKDGDLDYYLTNDGANPFHVKKQTSLSYDDHALAKGIDLPKTTSWGAVFFDYDNDTYLDLAVANGGFLKKLFQPTVLYRGSEQYSFSDVSEGQNIKGNTSGRGVVVSDIDNDGDLDFAVSATYHEEQSSDIRVLLYRNDNPHQNNWLRVKLEGAKSNHDGLGAWIKVVLNGETLLREINGGGSSYLSHSSIIAHFGLGNTTMIDSLIVDWIGGGKQVFTGVQSNQMVTIREDQPGNEVRENTICEFDSIFVENRYVKESGNYYDTLRDEKYDLFRIVQTKLMVKSIQKDTIEIFVESGNDFKGNTITKDTILIELKAQKESCPKAIVYNVKVEQITGLSSVMSRPIIIYPNPVTDCLKLHLEGLKSISQGIVQLFDPRGKMIKYSSVSPSEDGSIELHIKELKPGIYHGKIRINNTFESFKIIKL